MGCWVVACIAERKRDGRSVGSLMLGAYFDPAEGVLGAVDLFGAIELNPPEVGSPRSNDGAWFTSCLSSGDEDSISDANVGPARGYRGFGVDEEGVQFLTQIL